MTFSGNFMPRRFGVGKPKPKKEPISAYTEYVRLPPDGPKVKKK